MAIPAPDTAGSDKPSERVPAVWPWLLIPLVALALYFTLSRLRSEQIAASADAPAAVISPPNTDSSANVR
jgi:hypothetical protein